MSDPAERVAFGTSGHRGTPLQRHVHGSAHPRDHAGDLRLPPDTGHRRAALHGQGHARAVGACPADGARSPGRQRRRHDHPAGRRGDADAGDLARDSSSTTAAGAKHLADGIVITPSHNPPEDGGFKYNPPNGGPADTDVTRWVEDRANALLLEGRNAGVKRVPFGKAISAADHACSTISSCPTSTIWRNVIDMDAIRAATLKLGVDPLGGAALAYWDADQRDLRARHHGRQPGGRSARSRS